MASKIFSSYKIRALKSHFRRSKKRLYQRTLALGSPPSSPRVTLVAGVQRSGTNMLMNVLDQSLETDVYMEKDHRAFDRYAMRDLASIDSLIARSTANNFVIKALMESHNALGLMEHFGKETITLWLYRSFDDMVNSYMVSWPGGRNRLDEIIHGEKRGIWQASGMTAGTLTLLKSYYRPEMNDASALALCWYYRNQLFFDQHLEHNDNAMLLNYEQLVSEPTLTISEIADFLDIPATSKMTKFISARSVNKRPQPPIEPSIRDLCEDMSSRLTEALRKQQS